MKFALRRKKFKDSLLGSRFSHRNPPCRHGVVFGVGDFECAPPSTDAAVRCRFARFLSPDPCRRLAHETHEPHENQTNAKRFIVLFSPWVGEMKAGLILPGTASFRVIRVFRGALRLHHYGLVRKHAGNELAIPVGDFLCRNLRVFH
jgi:hypothetical protein